MHEVSIAKQSKCLKNEAKCTDLKLELNAQTKHCSTKQKSRSRSVMVDGLGTSWRMYFNISSAFIPWCLKNRAEHRLNTVDANNKAADDAAAADDA